MTLIDATNGIGNINYDSDSDSDSDCDNFYFQLKHLWAPDGNRTCNILTLVKRSNHWATTTQMAERRLRSAAGSYVRHTYCWVSASRYVSLLIRVGPRKYFRCPKKLRSKQKYYWNEAAISTVTIMMWFFFQIYFDYSTSYYIFNEYLRHLST